MRVGMLTATPVNTNGWGRYTRDLVTALAAYHVEIVLITSIDAPLTTDLPVVDYHRILPSLTPAPRHSSLRILATIPPVRRLTDRCDVVHVVAEPYVLSTVGLRRRIFVTAHGTYIPQTSLRRGIGPLYRWAYRRARLICVSHYTERQVQTVLPGAHTIVIPNGVDAARYVRSNQSMAPVEKHGPTILAVGQVKPRKGFHILARAVKKVRDEVPDAKMVFIGDTSDTAYRQSIQAQLEADGVADAVQWSGRLPDEAKIAWYHTADVFALPAMNVEGSFEGFGLVYLEAGAAGLPVVGTVDCGAEEAIRDGETGFLVPQNDPDSVANAILRLLRDRELRIRMGAAGVQLSAQHTWAKVAQRVIDCYQETTT